MQAGGPNHLLHGLGHHISTSEMTMHAQAATQRRGSAHRPAQTLGHRHQDIDSKHAHGKINRQVTRYKGSSAPEHASFLPSSEAQLLRAGTPSPLYNATTLALLRRGLDADAEAAAGYTYDDIFSEHGITPSVATAAVHAL